MKASSGGFQSGGQAATTRLFVLKNKESHRREENDFLPDGLQLNQAWGSWAVRPLIGVKRLQTFQRKLFKLFKFKSSWSKLNVHSSPATQILHTKPSAGSHPGGWVSRQRARKSCRQKTKQTTKNSKCGGTCIKTLLFFSNSLQFFIINIRNTNSTCLRRLRTTKPGFQPWTLQWFGKSNVFLGLKAVYGSLTILLP